MADRTPTLGLSFTGEEAMNRNLFLIDKAITEITGGGDTAARIAALETQVADLTARVTALENPVAGDEPSTRHARHPRSHA